MANDITSTQAPIGTSRYVVLMYAPAMNSLLSNGGGFAFATRLGGLAYFQTNSTAISVSTLGLGGGNLFNSPGYALSSLGLLGTTFSSTEGVQSACTYASELEVNIIANRTAIGGVAFFGSVTVAQFLSGLTLANLISYASEMVEAQKTFVLRGHLVSGHMYDNTSRNYVVADMLNFMSSESIHYVVLQDYILPLTGGATATYTMSMNVNSSCFLQPAMNSKLVQSLSDTKDKDITKRLDPPMNGTNVLPTSVPSYLS